MLNISKYLEKFKKNLESGEDLNKRIIDVIKKHTNISLNSNDFEIKNYIIQVKSTPAVKNKIFISKNNIISDINNKNIIDIK